ncbi:hypothetical protein [Amorphus orientalis]|uniref:Uncharacterized protein n=1 Tax=Amorphus orientalis TaxID=649198 RepID=A0AAE4ARP2_9HYPH|nr:hypothetical protein [Amorphus orientalis]MDQ0314412.1 hypothetical protein [Amorphus orientalis]
MSDEEVSVEAFEISEILGGGHTADGRFVALVKLQDDSQQGLMMAPSRVDALATLLQAALLEAQGQRLSFTVPVSLEGKLEASDVSVEATPAGTFRVGLKDKDENTVEIAMSLKKAAEWRDALAEKIALVERAQRGE